MKVEKKPSLPREIDLRKERKQKEEEEKILSLHPTPSTPVRTTGRVKGFDENRNESDDDKLKKNRTSIRIRIVFEYIRKCTIYS